MTFVSWIKARTATRKPDFVIAPAHKDGPYMNRWWVIPRNPVFNIYLHQFLRSDEDFALHDHPWLFNFSSIVEGKYVEHTIATGGVNQKVTRRAGDKKFRWGPSPHRVELIEGDCWTIFITGPVVRTWGFHCPKGWIPFHQKITLTKNSSTGREECP